MTNAEILTEHPSLTEKQIVKYEIATSESIPETISSLLSCPSLVWVRDQGNVAIMKATSYVTVRIDHVRNGQYNGAVFVSMSPNDTIEIRQNLDGQNYDGFSC